MLEIATAKKEILEEISMFDIEISRELLLKCLINHQNVYDDKILSAKNKYILDEAIKEIWQDTFNVEIGEIIHGKSEATNYNNSNNKRAN